MKLKDFILFEIVISIGTSANVGLFCNSGPYSHDAYLSQLADNVLSYGHNVSVIQVKVFRFKNRVPFSEKFQNYVSYDFSDDLASKRAQEKSQQLMWEVIMPYDMYNGSLIGIHALLGLQKSFLRGCGAAFGNRTFMDKIRNLNLDFLIIDYAVNDGAIGVANILNIPTAYISIVPFYSNYIDYMGIPSNPAYVPAFISNFEPYEEFSNRLINVLSYVGLVLFRRVFYNRANTMLYETLNAKLDDLSSLERKNLMVSSPWEMFLDMSRPLARNLRYLGCENCISPLPNQTQINFTKNLPTNVILVSFGTLVNAEDIPVVKLQELAKAFSQFPNYTFIWQLDVSNEYFQDRVLRPINMEMPRHLGLHRWIPMKRLLIDPKVILVITHGGATTCLEAAYSGKPMLGIAIHSDQYHNTQRFAQRGLGEALTVLDIDQEIIADELNRILSNYDR